jgi:hypothetical protein
LDVLAESLTNPGALNILNKHLSRFALFLRQAGSGSMAGNDPSIWLLASAVGPANTEIHKELIMTIEATGAVQPLTIGNSTEESTARPALASVGLPAKPSVGELAQSLLMALMLLHLRNGTQIK